MTFKEYFRHLSEGREPGDLSDDEYFEIIRRAKHTMSKLFYTFHLILQQLNIIYVKNESKAQPTDIPGTASLDAPSHTSRFVSIPDIETMAVDGKGNLYINVVFLQKLTPKEVVGVLCHEILHVVYHHMSRLGSRNITIYNYATDLYINNRLVNVDEAFTLPKYAIIPDRSGHWVLDSAVTKSGKDMIINITNKDTDEIYSIIYDLVDPTKFKPKPGFDVHDHGGTLAKKAEEQGAVVENATVAEIESRVNTAINIAHRDMIAGRVDKTTTGKMIEIAKANIPWRYILKKFLSEELNKVERIPVNRPNRYSYNTGTYWPAEVNRPVQSIRLYATVDVSGSVTLEQIGRFRAELQKLAREFNEQVNVIYWSSDVTESEIIGPKSSNPAPMVSTGTTRISSVATYYEKKKLKPQLVIYLTDGYVEPEKEQKYVYGARNLFIIIPTGSDQYIKAPRSTFVKMLD